jgi:hypothetical protein
MQIEQTAALNFTLIIPTLCERPSQLEFLLNVLGESKYTCKIIVVSNRANHDELQVQLRKFCPNFSSTLVPEKENAGLAHAINLGLEVLETKYWNWIGDDDVLELNAVANLIEKLEGNRMYSFAYGSSLYFDSTGSLQMLNRSGKFAQQLIFLGPNLIPQPSCVFRAEILGTEKFLNTAYKFAFDQDFIQRLLVASKALFVPIVVSKYRWSRNTLTSKNRESSIIESLSIRRKHARNLAEAIIVIILAPLSRFVVLASDSYFKARSNRFDSK